MLFVSCNIMVQVNRGPRPNLPLRFEPTDYNTLLTYKFLIQSMIVLHLFAAPLPSCTTITCSKHFSHDNHFVRSSTVPRLSLSHVRTRIFLCSARNRQKDLNGRDFSIDIVKEDQELEDDGDDGFLAQGMYARRDAKDIDEEEAQENEDDDSGYSGRGPYTGRPGKDYDRDPELGNILGSFLEDPQAAQSKVSITLLMV